MKRKALLIGNNRGLQGVPSDLLQTRRFLQSSLGGEWFSSEIEQLLNPRKSDLLKKLDGLKRERNDFSFVLFTGHGAHARNTLLELNAYEETISENDLIGLSERQVSIFDCCRNIVKEEVIKSSVITMDSIREATSTVRARYDIRIMQSIPQQAKLYSCAIGESSYDDNGAVYLGNLLSCAKNIGYAKDYKLLSEAHAEASVLTSRHVLNKFKSNQNPTASLPKCLASQELIISIK